MLWMKSPSTAHRESGLNGSALSRVGSPDGVDFAHALSWAHIPLAESGKTILVVDAWLEYMYNIVKGWSGGGLESAQTEGSGVKPHS
jgi:hypothetical protein